ncbi:MAG: hypothetical protein GWN58_23030 [Anaerolineae bacterium]|nr:hypothetical protein [Thermoplasmata archaeon]NIV32250.1 hypothetical protein [Anaerolineae bacterium]NIY03702.1 hypothetical protein [Thermoplasmata archaeon]
MARYCVFTADWDALRALDDNRDTLVAVTWHGKTVDPKFYDDGFWLEADCLGAVFERLNLDPPASWQRRSLSVGDVVVDPEGKAHVCCPVGWKAADDVFAACAKVKGVWACL